jgi:hypothetical protein
MDTWYVQLIVPVSLLTALLWPFLSRQNCKHSQAESLAVLTSLLDRLPLQLAMLSNRWRTGRLEDEGNIQDRCCHALIPEAREKPRVGNLYLTYSQRLICIDVKSRCVYVLASDIDAS